MITLIISLFIISILFGVAIRITGALAKALMWMCIFLPIGLVLWGLGIACCCTLILLPVGIMLFKAGARVIIPG